MNIPILGQGQPQPDRIDRKYGTVHDRKNVAQGDILDSEVAEIHEVFQAIAKRNGQRRDIDAFQREIEDRFHKIGWAVDVAWYEFAIDGVKQDGCYMPEISIIGRVDRGKFDPDQMVHEVTNNLLDLKDEDAGVIKFERPPEKGHQH